MSFHGSSSRQVVSPEPLPYIPGGSYLGLAMTMTGVALLDLGEIYGASISAVSQIITTRCAGILIGSLVGGKLYDTYNTQVVSILVVALTCFTSLMIPLCGFLPLAHVTLFFEGFSWGAFCTGANVWIMKMWPENPSPGLQIFHLAFGLGCVVAPLIARPFLSTQGSDKENSSTDVTNVTFNDTDDFHSDHLEPPNTRFVQETSSGSTIYYAYRIASALQLIPVASMTILYFIDKTSFQARRTSPVNRSGASMQGSEPRSRFVRTVLAMLCVYMFIYVAVHCTMSQMMTAFAVKCDLHFSKPLASRLVAVFFLCFAASRLAAALVTVRVAAFSVLVASHVVLVAAATVLLAWGSSSATALWVGCALAGVAQGPLNAAVTAWVAKHINISNKMMAIVGVIGGLGSLSPPLLVGHFLDSTPNAYLYVSFAAVTLSTVLLLGMCFYLRRRYVFSENKHPVIANDERPDERLTVQTMAQQ